VRTLLILAILGLVACGVQGANMKIVDNGKSDYVILTPANASASETLAAQEMSKYIELMSGAKLEIKAQGDDPPGKAIVLNELGKLAGPYIDYDRPIVGDEYRIWAEGATINVLGARGRSVLYAVYDVLGRIGCRFLAPNLDHYQGTNEIIPKKKTLSIDLSTPIIETPALTFRKLYVEEGHSHNAENLAQMAEWMPKARFNTLVVPTDYSGRGVVKWDNWRVKLAPELQKRDITIEVGGHGYQNFMKAEMENGKLFDQHPDWFGVDDTGKRIRVQNRVFCTSNPDAVKYLANNVVAYLKARPEIQIFDFWPPDGARWCECAKCKALGTPSNRQAILIAQVKDYLVKAGLETRIEAIAYAAAVTPPESAKLIPDLLLDFCPIAQCFEVQINDPSSEQNANYVTQLKGLRAGFTGDISIYSYYRKYAWKSLPNLIPHFMQKDLQFYRTIPTEGISSYAEPGDWFTYELNHYVLGNLAWNTDADVDKLVAKFAEARYGSASKAAIHAYGVLEELVAHYCCLPGSSLKSVDGETKAQEKIVTEMHALEAAKSAVSDAGIKRNIDRLLLTFEYVRLDLDVQKAKAANAPKADEQKAVKTVCDFLHAHDTDGITTSGSRGEYTRLLKTYGVSE
jgi:hypothetical protein